MVIRVVGYRIKDPGVGGDGEETDRLITTILDSATATAPELAAPYPQRWEIEISIKEGRTILRRGRITLRSKKPDLLRQEF